MVMFKLQRYCFHIASTTDPRGSSKRKRWNKRWKISGLMVGAPRFELGTPSLPDFGACLLFIIPFNPLGNFAGPISGLISGLCDVLQCRGHLAIQHMRIAERRF